MGSMLRDLVEGECAEPNALGGFVQQFIGNKAGQHHDQWELENGMHNLSLNMDHSNMLLHNDHRDLDRIFEQTEDINAMIDRNISRDHHQHLLHHQDPESLYSEDHISGKLQHFFKDFILSSQSHNLLPPIPIGEIGLSNQDKLKIKNRSEVLLKHINEKNDDLFEQNQLNRLFDALDIDPGMERFDDLDQHWQDGDWNDFRGMDDGTTITSTANNRFHEGAPWENENRLYQNHKNIPNDLIDEEEENYGNAWDDAVHDNEYDEAWGEEEDFNPFENAWRDTGEDQSVDAAWDETARQSLSSITESITKINDPKLRKSNFMKLMRQFNSGEATIVGNQVVHNPENEQQQYQDFGEDLDDEGQAWVDEYPTYNETIDHAKLREYQFIIDEAKEDDTYERGMELFNNGQLTDAVITLESEVMRNPENSDAWMLLGIAHAENDKDQQAIQCLTKSIQVNSMNLKARLALAVSFTNDYKRERALETLDEWLSLNPQYKHIRPTQPIPPQDELQNGNGYMDTWTRHSITSEMFLEAARMRPNNPDPEVQTALGLLYNMSYEYDKAVDCFKAALHSNPTDYQLWNKLGATLANSNRSQEALGAYFQALEHKPTYVRARSNLGISYLALNMYKEAAQTFLGALAIHPEAVHIWDSLKMVARLMNREDLVEMVNRRDLSEFKDEFNFL